MIGFRAQPRQPLGGHGHFFKEFAQVRHARAVAGLVRRVILAVLHHDLLARHAGQLLEAAGEDHVGQLAARRGSSGRSAARRSACGAGPGTGCPRRRSATSFFCRCAHSAVTSIVDRVLHALRQLGHAALAVGQLQLMLAHRAAELARRCRPELLQGEVDVLGQARVHARRPAAGRGRRTSGPATSLRRRPARCAASRAWTGLAGLKRLHAVLLQRLADRLEELPCRAP